MFKKITVALTACVAMTSVSAHAGEFPERPVRLVVPYAAGGGTDMLTRLISKSMSEALGQSVVVENRPGGGTVIGASEVARAAPDGYTMLWGDNTTFALNPHLYEKLPYDPIESFKPVSQTFRSSMMMVAGPSTGIKTVQELINYAQANPGKLQYGSAGNASPHHQAMELLKLKTGIDAIHVPYKGESPALNDVLGGFVDVMFVGTSSAKRNAEAGRLNILAYGDSIPNRAMQHIPTVEQAGVKGYEFLTWQGLVVPAGTPDEVIEKLHAAYAKAAVDPGITQFLDNMGAGLQFLVSSPQEFGALIREEKEKAGHFVKAINLTVE